MLGPVPEPADPPEWWRLSDYEAFWLGEFCHYGMTVLQAEALVVRQDVDKHAVRESLRIGCDPSTCFDLYS